MNGGLSRGLGPITRVRRGWGITAVLSLALTVSFAWFEPFDGSRLLRDQFVRWSHHAPDPEIVIVGIDEDSLARIGRWPWPRAVQAAGIERISRGKPRVIGLDILFEEPETPLADEALVRAIRSAGNAVLPVVMEGGNGKPWYAGLPSTDMLDATAGLGHVNLELDRDGLARNVFLQEGLPGHTWDHFTLAMLRVAGRPMEELPGERNPLRYSPDHAWLRDARLAIPFSGPPGNIPIVPFAKVLSGEIAPEFFRNKYVLIGATAPGLGDAFVTPISAQSRPMAGVEISANLLDGLLHRRWIDEPTPLQRTLFNTLPILLVLAGMLWLRPNAVLRLIALVLALVLGASWFAFGRGLWLPPAAAVFVLILLYPLWSWGRLQVAIQFIADEVQRLNADLPIANKALLQSGGDPLDQRIHAMRGATSFLRDLHRFAVDNFNTLPDAALIVDQTGRVLQANPAAVQFFARASAVRLAGLTLTELMAGLRIPGMSDLDSLLGTNQPVNAEFKAIAPDDRDLLIKFVSRTDAAGQVIGLVVSLVDISRIVAAERGRDEALRFISHDIRSPQSAILASLYMLEESQGAEEREGLLDRIRRNALSTIRLADDFVALSRAESTDYTVEELELNSLLLDAGELQWDLARSHGIELRFEAADAPAFALGNRDLLQRALGNLVNNAIKYGPRGSVVHCAVLPDPEGWRIEISDGGSGIPEAERDQLFTRFRRLSTAADSGESGMGLGLAFVRRVFEGHQGRVWLKSSTSAGSCFAALIPASVT